MDGRRWPTVEHYYQAAKFPEDFAHQERIRQAATPLEAKRLGSARSKQLRADWDGEKEGVMRCALRFKFDEHPRLRQTLLDTGERPLIERTQLDYYWGCGKMGTGLNRLGMLLMELRDELAGRTPDPAKYARPEAGNRSDPVSAPGGVDELLFHIECALERGALDRHQRDVVAIALSHLAFSDRRERASAALRALRNPIARAVLADLARLDGARRGEESRVAIAGKSNRGDSHGSAAGWSDLRSRAAGEIDPGLLAALDPGASSAEDLSWLIDAAPRMREDSQLEAWRLLKRHGARLDAIAPRIGALLRARTRAERAGGRVLLACLGPQAFARALEAGFDLARPVDEETLELLGRLVGGDPARIAAIPESAVPPPPAGPPEARAAWRELAWARAGDPDQRLVAGLRANRAFMANPPSGRLAATWDGISLWPVPLLRFTTGQKRPRKVVTAAMHARRAPSLDHAEVVVDWLKNGSLRVFAGSRGFGPDLFARLGARPDERQFRAWGIESSGDENASFGAQLRLSCMRVQRQALSLAQALHFFTYCERSRFAGPGMVTGFGLTLDAKRSVLRVWSRRLERPG